MRKADAKKQISKKPTSAKKTAPTNKIIKKTTVAKPVKKTVSAKVSKKISKKVVSKPDTPIVKKPAIEEADSPEDIKVSGWKKNIKAGRAPRILRPKVETWDVYKEERKTVKRKRGVLILVDGLPKVGKTNIALSAVNFEGHVGKRRDIPPGKPVYVLDTENATEDEADFHFGDNMDEGDIIIRSIFIERPDTKEIDPVKSLEELEEWAYALTEETRGTLIIDNFTDYCDWVYYKLVDVILGYGFDDDGVEKQKPTPMQYKWRNKKIKTFLRRLRFMPINIVLIAQVKAEWESGKGAYDGRKTGEYITEAIEGLQYWVDIVARYEKDYENNEVVRRLIITDSRFETKDMKGRKYEIEGDPTFQGIIDLFKDLL